VSNPKITGPIPLTVVDITAEVTPLAPNVGMGLTQQFTAVAIPDAAPQEFSWTCSLVVKGVVTGSCANFSAAPGPANGTSAGLAFYTANDTCTGSCVIQVMAASTIDPNGCSPNPTYCTSAAVSLVTSRVSGTYAFQFSGYDSNHNPTAVAGTFTASSNGTITSGVEEELTSSGWAQYSITGGPSSSYYTPTKSDTINSNNAGTLTLALPAKVYPNQYQVVLDSNGDLEMIESDGNGSGSGIAKLSSNANFFSGPQTYAFGFTGMDSGGRVGYAGLLTTDGNGNIISGLMDVNDHGQSSNSICSSPPCAVTGTYTSNGNGSWQLALTSPVTMNFDFYIASGSSSKSNPLTFYAISTDPTANPAVSGMMVLQDSSPTCGGSQTCYDNATLKGTSISALTGTGTTNGALVPGTTNVSITLGSTDGSGDFSGTFDQNNDGTILTGIQFPSTSQSPSPYTYAAYTSNNGRYTFYMLGNPSAKTVVAPLEFILYASGVNRGFLLDQSSPSVMTGAMNPQGKIPCVLGICGLSTSELPGTYAAATTNSGSSTVNPLAANLLLDEETPQTGPVTFNISGTQYQFPTPGSQSVAGTYSLNAAGNGPFALTEPATQSYVIYVLGTSGCNGSAKNPTPVCSVQSFFMIDEDTANTAPSIIFAQQ